MSLPKIIAFHQTQRIMIEGTDLTKLNFSNIKDEKSSEKKSFSPKFSPSLVQISLHVLGLLFFMSCDIPCSPFTVVLRHKGCVNGMRAGVIMSLDCIVSEFEVEW